MRINKGANWRKVFAIGLCFLMIFSGVGCKQSNDKKKEEHDPVQTNYVDTGSAPSVSGISETVEYTVYYFDAENGNDDSDGSTKFKPKRSLAEVNEVIDAVNAETPTKILFNGFEL